MCLRRIGVHKFSQLKKRSRVRLLAIPVNGPHGDEWGKTDPRREYQCKHLSIECVAGRNRTFYFQLAEPRSREAVHTTLCEGSLLDENPQRTFGFYGISDLRRPSSRLGEQPLWRDCNCPSIFRMDTSRNSAMAAPKFVGLSFSLK